MNFQKKLLSIFSCGLVVSGASCSLNKAANTNRTTIHQSKFSNNLDFNRCATGWCGFNESDRAVNPVISALKRFKFRPIKIDWLQNYKKPVTANSDLATAAIRKSLISQDKSGTINKSIANQISFGVQKLLPGRVSGVNATYKTKTVYVMVVESPTDDAVAKALKQFQSRPLLINWFGNLKPIRYVAMLYNPKAMAALHRAIMEQDQTRTFFDYVANKIGIDLSCMKCKEEVLTPGIQTSMTLTYQGPTIWKRVVPVQVREDLPPTPVPYALKYFGKHPLVISWDALGYYTNPLSVTTLKAAKIIRQALVKQDKSKKITKEVAKNIKFKDFGRKLELGKTTPISAEYEWHQVLILIQVMSAPERYNLKKITFKDPYYPYNAQATYWLSFKSFPFIRNTALYDATFTNDSMYSFYSYIIARKPKDRGEAVFSWMKDNVYGFVYRDEEEKSKNGCFVDTIMSGRFGVLQDSEIIHDLETNMNNLINFVIWYHTSWQTAPAHIGFRYQWDHPKSSVGAGGELL